MLINFLLCTRSKSIQCKLFSERDLTLSIKLKHSKHFGASLWQAKNANENLHFKWGVLWNSTLPKLLGPQFFPNCICT